ncbi:MAG: zinc ribbon domain-containing protein [Lachnospiraceae bacterium]|nr:zinc ribbon domain-containing protein [Lachnospiraceae bacterium]
MNRSVVSTISKWLCVAFVAISVLLLLSGSITIEDKSDRKAFTKSMKNDLKDLNSKETNKQIKEWQKGADDEDIDFDFRKFFDRVEKTMKMISDGTVSPFELGTTGPSMIAMINSVVNNEDLEDLYVPDEDDIEELENYKGVMVYGIILFYLTLVVGIVVIILHIVNNKLPGFSFAVVELIMLISLSVMAKGDFLMESMDDNDLVLTGAPVWAFILALLNVGLWLFKDKLLDLIFGPEVNTAATITCPSCGKALRPGVAFCTNCGEKFAPAPAAPAPAPAAPAPAPVAPAKVVCTNCGAEIVGDSDFCTQCGTKVVR